MKKKEITHEDIIEQQQSVEIVTWIIRFYNIETIAINLLVNVCKLILACFCTIKTQNEWNEDK